MVKSGLIDSHVAGGTKRLCDLAELFKGLAFNQKQVDFPPFLLDEGAVLLVFRTRILNLRQDSVHLDGLLIILARFDNFLKLILLHLFARVLNPSAYRSRAEEIINAETAGCVQIYWFLDWLFLPKLKRADSKLMKLSVENLRLVLICFTDDTFASCAILFLLDV